MAKETRSGSTNGCMSLLRNINRDQLFEVLSQGFCQNCDTLLVDRVNSFFKTENESWSSEKSDKTDQKKSSSRDSITTHEPKKENRGSLPSSSNNNCYSSQHSDFEELVNDELSEEQENIRVSQMGHKDDFCCFERVSERLKNVHQGLELYTRVFNAEEQKKIVEFVNYLQDKGRIGKLRGRTYAEPRNWMRGKGRVTIQFGCCYNYARDRDGNPPGIVRDAEVEPLPQLFKQMIKRMVRWRVLPETCVPDSCIVNIYEKGDCIPPHIDHNDFARPFCTVSLVSDCNILFGSDLKIFGAGEFEGHPPIYLPIGSVLIFNGNGANISKHCISAVSKKRISITFKKMDIRKRPYNFQPDPDMQRIKPLIDNPVPIKSHYNKQTVNKPFKAPTKKRVNDHDDFSQVEKDEFRHVRRARFRH